MFFTVVSTVYDYLVYSFACLLSVPSCHESRDLIYQPASASLNAVNWNVGYLVNIVGQTNE
jgi:protein involved in temperature-dependent protein secretion